MFSVRESLWPQSAGQARLARVIKLQQMTHKTLSRQVFQRWEYKEDLDVVKNLDTTGRLCKIWGRHFIEVWSSLGRRRPGRAASTNKCREYKLPSRDRTAPQVKAFHISEDFLFHPNMFRMSVSTGQLDIGLEDSELINDNNKRKSKKKRIFPSASQLLSRYSGTGNYRV